MKVNNLVLIEEKSIQIKDLFFTLKTKEWCKLPYPNHKNGCPNYNKSPFCPPNSPYYKEKIKKYKNLKLVIASFDFHQYKTKMKQIHPNWTNRQLGNVLYWQSQVKKKLKEYISKLKPDLILGCGSGLGTYSIESVGINIIRSLIHLKIEIQVKPKEYIKLICLIGYKNSKLTQFF